MSSLTPHDYSVVCPPHPHHCQTNNEMRILIQKRTRRNHEYWYNYPSQNKSQFWNSITSTVNSTCNSSYISTQCSNKFQSLKTEYYVSKRKYIYILYYNINNILIIFNIFQNMCHVQAACGGRKSQAGFIFFDLFNTRFWERPGMYKEFSN